MREMIKDLISIIVPVYNVDMQISECLLSILSQSYINFEVILIDDGSTDKSGQICDEFAQIDKRVKVFHKKNEGVSNTRNYGLNLAQGEFIGFVDPDDWIAEDMYEQLLYNLNAYDADISICSYTTDVKMSFHNEKSNHESRIYTGEEAVREIVIGGKIGNYVWNKLFKSYLFDNISFPMNRIWEDIGTIYKVFMKANKCIYINEIKYFYRNRHKSITHNKENMIIMLQDIFVLYKERLDLLSSVYEDLCPYMIADALDIAVELQEKKQGKNKELSDQSKSEIFLSACFLNKYKCQYEFLKLKHKKKLWFYYNLPAAFKMYSSFKNLYKKIRINLLFEKKNVK